MLRAYDKATGKEVGAVYMPAPQTGSPMTYMLNGKQYIVVAIRGGIQRDGCDPATVLFDAGLAMEAWIAGAPSVEDLWRHEQSADLRHVRAVSAAP